MNIRPIITCLVLITTTAPAQTPLPLVRSDSFDPYATPPVDCDGAGLSQPMLSQLIRKTGVSSTWLLSGGDNAMNVGEINLQSTIIVPVMLAGSPLLVTPSATVTLLDGPQGFGVPGALYRFSASLMWMKQINDHWRVMLGVTPGISSDLHATEDSFRLFAMGAATYNPNEFAQWTFGAAVTGRNDIPVLPLVGVTLTPNSDTRIEISAPRPRFAKRVHPSELLALFDPTFFEHWIYVAGELGGGTWAVRRDSGVDDLLTIRDFRVIGGYEAKTADRFHTFMEAGYVFARELEYENDDSSFEPSDAVLLRAGISY